jgi:hypothetical protein
MKRAAPALAALIAALAIAGCGAGTFTIRGGLVVEDTTDGVADCQFAGTGYSDIAPGTQVTVTAPDGTVIGAGELRRPVIRAGGTVCLFPFTVTGVQGGEARYGVSVSRRGTVWFSPQKVTGATLELGSP